MKWYKYDIQCLTDSEFYKWYLLMGEDKRRRVDKFRFEEDKKRTVAGEMLARKAISDWCGIMAENISFDTKENGKPYAKDLTVEFNISHSENIVLCAVSNKSVGVDIEKIRPIDRSIMERVCKSNELKYALSDNSYRNFFEIWTFKEAYFKQVGTGITDFSSVDYYGNTKKRMKLYFDEYVAHIIY